MNERKSISPLRVSLGMRTGLFVIASVTYSVSTFSTVKADELFVSTAVPILEQFCYDCHDSLTSKADINLEQLIETSDFAGDFKTWELVAEMLEQKNMPPDDEPQPSDEQRTLVGNHVHEAIDHAIGERAGDPGEITMRRLTSGEYAYTIQDLTGLDLGLEKILSGDAVGGEGFSNVGDVQFVQDSTIERYLEAAKTVASHALIASGPLSFYDDPGMTGQELSAINRIQKIYRDHGFRTGAGEGAEAFGLDKYPKAFFAAWQFQHRDALGKTDATLLELAKEHGLEPRFLEHVWQVFNNPSLLYPAYEFAAEWRKLPSPEEDPEAVSAEVRDLCEELYENLRDWQSMLASNAGDAEESPVFTEGVGFNPASEHTFRVSMNADPDSGMAKLNISVVPASNDGSIVNPALIWKEPSVSFREANGFGGGRGGRTRGGGNRGGQAQPDQNANDEPGQPQADQQTQDQEPFFQAGGRGLGGRGFGRGNQEPLELDSVDDQSDQQAQVDDGLTPPEIPVQGRGRGFARGGFGGGQFPSTPQQPGQEIDQGQLPDGEQPVAQAGGRGFGGGGFGGRGRGRGQTGTPLKDLLSPEMIEQLNFGQGFDGESIDENSFVTYGATSFSFEIKMPEGSTRGDFMVDVELDTVNGDDGLVRAVILSEVQEGNTVAATGGTSALLANPEGENIGKWRAGVTEFARFLPQVSHREPAPSDRDPIPLPWDNTYNKPERNEFHYVVKYHRDDRFLSEHILGAEEREQLDQAWADLLTAFDYHDTNLRFIDRKFNIGLGDRSIADISPEWVVALPEEPRGHVAWLYLDYLEKQNRLREAQGGQVEDAIEFANEAWRRPLTQDEESGLRDFYATMKADPDLDHSEAMRLLITRILVSPAFLYRAENLETPQELVALSDWDLANRLSYFIWSSKPDEELQRAAVAGELTNPDQLALQARRMLGDPKARRMATEFFGQWFGFYRFDEFRGIDTGRFTEFTENLKVSMYDEAISFFEHIIREDRPVQEIIFADYTFLNNTLAEHYEIETSEELASEMTRVDGLKEFHRGGLLELGVFHATTSAPLRTSAVKRGDWILRRVLGTPVPPPPGDAGSIPGDDVLADGLTVRQRLEAHRTDTTCVNCHSRIDPLGFALEHFDPIGRWRETYRDGQEIDAGGTLSDGQEISQLTGLLDYLSDQDELFFKTLSTKLLGYALGRAELVYDRPLLKQMVDSIEGDSQFSNLVVQVVQSQQFRYRRGSSEESRMTGRQNPVFNSN